MAMEADPNPTLANWVGGFPDNFCRSTLHCARHRARLPQELCAYLAGLAPAPQLGWDRGTGSGQADLGMAGELERVIATCTSPDQVGRAIHTAGIEHRAEAEERASLATDSADLATAVPPFTGSNSRLSGPKPAAS